MYPYPYEDPKRERKLQYFAALGKEMKKAERRKADAERSAKQASQRTMTSLEWFIIGIIMQPVVGPLYNAALLHLNTMVH